jgi:tetratricopeptide (TPR) repeat protein
VNECPFEMRWHSYLGLDHGPEVGPQEEEDLLSHRDVCPRCQETLQDLLASRAQPVPQGPPPGVLDRMWAEARRATWPQFDDYEVLDRIGGGNTGEVFKARKRQGGSVVALKVLRASLAADAVERTRFRSEVETAGRLSHHPGVVRVNQSGEHEGRPFLCMEFLEGGSLAERLPDFIEAPTETARLLVAVAEAVAYAHANNLIHRDLKPSNILFRGAHLRGNDFLRGLREGQVAPVVVDFGLARLIEGAPGLTRSGEVVGTLDFLAPEQVDGEGLGVHTDVYALGAVLYACCTGRPPFSAATTFDTLTQIKDLLQEPERPSRSNRGVPRDLETICLKCLRKEPEKRYGTAADLAADLGRLLQRRAILARRAPIREKVWKGCRRKPVRAVTIAVIVAAAVGLFRWGQQAYEYRTNLRSALEASEQIALAQVRAGRFESAEETLQEACRRIDKESDPADLRPRLQARRDRVHQLVRFYQLADDVERFTFLQDNAQALGAAEEALSVLEVFAHEQWWAHLPDAELSRRQGEHLQRGQKEHLQNEVYRQMLYATALRATDAVTSRTSQERKAKFRSALEILPLAEKFRRSHSASMLNRFCRFGLFELGSLRPLPQGDPSGAVDYYFLGIAHCMMHSRIEHPLSRFFRGLPRFVVSDLDFNTPLPTAERLLSKAALIEPQHYFTYLFLTLALEEKPREAELVANTCISLRPDYGVGYEARATALLEQLWKTTDAKLKLQLYEQAMADCEKAIALGRPTFRAFLGRGLLCGYRRQWATAARDVAKAVELVPNTPFFRRLLASMLVRAGDLQNYRRACELTLKHFREIKLDQAGLADLAIGCAQAPLDGTQAAEVVRLARQAADADPRSAHTRYGLGAAQYRLGQYEQALASLNESLRLGSAWASKPVNWPLLAMAHFRLGQVDKAKEWLDKASQWYEKEIAGKETHFGWVAQWWWDGVEFENLLSEARALIAPPRDRVEVKGPRV